MLKKISAALIVVSMLAAPAMAAGVEKTAPAPISKPLTKPVASVDAGLQAKTQIKPAVLNANAKMVRHHRHHHVRPHHRFHKKMGMLKTFKHTAHRSTVTHIKRG